MNKDKILHQRRSFPDMRALIEWAGEEYCVVLPATHAELRDAFSEIIILLSEAGVMQEMLDAMLPGAVALY